MIAPLEQIKELLRGETEELIIDQVPPENGRVVAVQPSVGNRAKCRVLVVDSWPLHEGGWVVLCQLAAQPHEPRLLHRRGAGHGIDGLQYTHDPAQAMPDEPEAVPKAYQDRISTDAHMLGHQENARRRLDWERRSILERVEQAVIEREQLGLDGGREMARLEAALAKLERRNAIERKQRAGKRAA